MLIKQFTSLINTHKKAFIFSSSLVTIATSVLLQQRFFSNNSSSTLNNMTSLPAPPQAPMAWNHTPNSIKSYTDQLIKEARALDDKIASLSENATFESVIKPFANLENKQAGLINQLSFYQHVSADKELRDASNEAEEKFNAYSIEAGLREDVFKSIHKVYIDTKDSKDLDAETKRFILKVNKQYERNGLALPLETREKIKELKQQLSTLAIKFSKNLGEETEFILFTKEQLKGVPEDVLSQFEEVKTDDGETKLKMTFKYPDIFPVLKFASNPDTRKAAFTGDQNKVPENSKILVKAVKLRAELAQLLGYNNFSEYILEERMAKTPETVSNFLADLKVKLKPLGEKELIKLKDLKSADLKAKGLPSENADYYVWDQRYYHTKMLETEYKVDEMKIAEYFPMANTISKMLQIYETIFTLKFVEISKNDKLYNTWHEEVKQFAVWKLDNQEDPEFVQEFIRPLP
ncbi:unnamed protein product [Ambrosiozyma monospora]|uniref:Unnamed protein product n=1 Tax=Ambrosiozyma monospora TaxID=43982 RepID=A0A9W6YNB1_AMBMO|nr:unnamed protein product [Ambrosiozyma monospora]